MLKFYHSPTSPNSRRVWIALLEKGLEFELVEVDFGNNEQFQPQFLELNPFHHVPILVDDNFSIVESLAILDYLEAKYPTPALMPKNAKAIAIVRMVIMVTVNELMTAITPLFPIFLGLPVGNSEIIEQAKQKVSTVLTFFERLLNDNLYFSGEYLTLAEVVAGTVIPELHHMGISLDDRPKLSAWCDRLKSRAAWAITQPSLEKLEAVKTRYKTLMAQQTSAL